MCARFKVANFLNSQLVYLLLVTWMVYAYRDIYPLTTYALQPMDVEEGWLIYAKIGVLSFVGIVIPLIIPSQYIPVDSKVI